MTYSALATQVPRPMIRQCGITAQPAELDVGEYELSHFSRVHRGVQEQADRRGSRRTTSMSDPAFLTHMILTPVGTRPGRWLPVALHPPTVRIPTSGAATTGLAHGVGGPLAFLATAHHAGHTMPGQPDAIHAAADWLVTWRTPEHTWPPHVSGHALDSARKGVPARTTGRTTAWCYGTPGIAAALTSAGRALGLPALSHTAADSMNALAARPPEDWDTEGTALCHGSAGILQSARRLSCRTLAVQAVHATLDVALASNPNGFLTGRAGTALALADLGGLLSRPPDAWDCLMLLS